MSDLKTFYIRHQYAIVSILGVLTLPLVPPMSYYGYALLFLFIANKRGFINWSDNESYEGIVLSITFSSFLSLCLIFCAYVIPDLFSGPIYKVLFCLIVINFFLYIYEVDRLKLFNKRLIYYKLHPDQKIHWGLFVAILIALLMDVEAISLYFSEPRSTISELQYVNIFILVNGFFYPCFAQLYIYRNKA